MSTRRLQRPLQYKTTLRGERLALWPRPTSATGEIRLYDTTLPVRNCKAAFQLSVVSRVMQGSWPALRWVFMHPSRKDHELVRAAGSQRDAASVIFNLPGYRVVDAVDLVWAVAGQGRAGRGGGWLPAWGSVLADGTPGSSSGSVTFHTPGRLRGANRDCAPSRPGGRTPPPRPSSPARARCTTQTALLDAVIGSVGRLRVAADLGGGVVDCAGNGQRRGGAAAGGRQPARPPARHRH